jgi:hypothetical protein
VLLDDVCQFQQGLAPTGVLIPLTLLQPTVGADITWSPYPLQPVRVLIP